MSTICNSIPPFKYTQTDGNLLLLVPASSCVADSLDRAEFDNVTRTFALSQAIVKSRFTSNTAANLMPEGPDTVTKPSFSRIAQQNSKEGQSCFKEPHCTHRLARAVSRVKKKVLIHFPLKIAIKTQFGHLLMSTKVGGRNRKCS